MCPRSVNHLPLDELSFVAIRFWAFIITGIIKTIVLRIWSRRNSEKKHSRLVANKIASAAVVDMRIGVTSFDLSRSRDVIGHVAIDNL